MKREGVSGAGTAWQMPSFNHNQDFDPLPVTEDRTTLAAMLTER
jgi:hypothetical protein